MSDLRDFLEAAGASLGDAQGSLTAGTGLPTAMALSEAELEVKAAVQHSAAGVQLRTLTSDEVARGAVQPAAVSTVRVRYVAVAGEPAGGAPSKSADTVIRTVRRDADLKRLEKILGGLDYTAGFEPSSGSWVVRALDADGRLVREVLIADA